MADSATVRNRFRKQEVGAKTNAWGGDWNEDGGSDRIDESLDGVSSFTLSGTKTLTSTNYETDEARMRTLNITSGRGGTITIPAVEKWYLVRNNTSGTVVFTAGGATTASVLTGATSIVICDATNCYSLSLSTYVTACQAAQTAAELAETNAGTSETNAAASASSASTSASAAAASAATAAATAASVVGTSTTSLAIAVASKTFTTQSGKNWTVGSYVIAASAADPRNYMFGQVTSYSGTTLIVDVQAVGGSGTKTDWNISLAGARGATGATGAAATYVQIGTATPTGTGTVNFTSIPSTYSDLLLVFAGVSLAGADTITIEGSGNNNSTRCTIAAAVTGGGADTLYQAFSFPGYLKPAGVAVSYGSTPNLTSDTTSSNATPTSYAWRIAAGINALRISTSTWNFDAGTITLYGI